MAHSMAVHVAILLALLVAPALAQPLEVVHLSTDIFEHQTQAATGQTTGHWCVLFVNSSNSDSKAQMAAEDAWEQLASDEDKQTIYAQVDVARSAAVATRFGVASTPSAILFRDRAMYPLELAALGLGDADKLAAAVAAFVSSGYDEQEALAVPDEPTVLSAVKDFMGLLEIEPSITLWLGIALMSAGLLLFLAFLISATYMSLPPKPPAAAAAAAAGASADKKTDGQPAAAAAAKGTDEAAAAAGSSSSSSDDDEGDAGGAQGAKQSGRVRRKA